ncbi:Protein MIF2 [Nakaseomyces glabratus]|nr:Protein MIF2 [Nakaseomyces glabratus]KTB26119.1 Protein MIF2 [Nakaseomyces glabratus]
MDYMNLGLRSRKTGIDVKKNLAKDEYSMENIDDFFKDDDTSFLSRRKSRKSSLLPEADIQNRILPSPLTKQHNVRDTDGFKVPQSINVSHRSTIERAPTEFQNSVISEDIPEVIPYEGQSATPDRNIEPIDEDELANMPKPRYRSQYNLGARNDDTDLINLTPEKDGRGTYNDVPDLIDDEGDTSKDNTTFNTSDHAMLEDEVEDGFILESEEDRDYMESDEGSLADDTDDASDSGDDIGTRFAAEINRPGNESPLSSDDEDYISENSTGHNRLEDEIDNPSLPTRLSKPYDIVDGVRRSKRVKIPPLEYWRNEKIQYKRRRNEPVLDIDKVITYNHSESEEESEEEQKKVKKQRKPVTRTRPYNYVPNGRPRGRPRKNISDDPNGNLIKKIENGEEPKGEWLKHGMLEATVKNLHGEAKTELVAMAPNVSQSEETKASGEDDYSIEILFDKYNEAFASGMLKVPVDGRKSPADSNTAFITFHVLDGIVEVTLDGKNFICTKGSSFQIPAYNEYAFANIGSNEVRMFFVQVSPPSDFHSEHY